MSGDVLLIGGKDNAGGAREFLELGFGVFQVLTKLFQMAGEPLGCILGGSPANLAAFIDKSLHQRICQVGSKPRIRIVVENLGCSRFSPRLHGQISLDAIDQLLSLKILLKNRIWIGATVNPARPEMLMRSRTLHEIELIDDQFDHLAALQNLDLCLEVRFRRRSLRCRV